MTKKVHPENMYLELKYLQLELQDFLHQILKPEDLEMPDLIPTLMKKAEQNAETGADLAQMIMLIFVTEVITIQIDIKVHTLPQDIQVFQVTALLQDFLMLKMHQVLLLVIEQHIHQEEDQIVGVHVLAHAHQYHHHWLTEVETRTQDHHHPVDLLAEDRVLLLHLH